MGTYTDKPSRLILHKGLRGDLRSLLGTATKMVAWFQLTY